MAHLCVLQNQALGVCKGFVPDIQICGTHGRKNLVNATIISNAEEEEPFIYTWWPEKITHCTMEKGVTLTELSVCKPMSLNCIIVHPRINSSIAINGNFEEQKIWVEQKRNSSLTNQKKLTVCSGLYYINTLNMFVISSMHF